MMYPRIFKLDSKGRLRFWQMELEGNKHRVISGLVGGNPATTGWTECKAKNVGRANATTADDQAQAEVEALYKKQLGREYHQTTDTVHEAKMFQPMLALLNEGDWHGPCYGQPKLDGIRCIAKADGLWTRDGQPITAVPHIWNSVAPLFDANPSLILDGELYNHALKDNLPMINSLVRKQKGIDEEHTMQYHVYDTYIPDTSFKDRSAFLTTLFTQNQIPTVHLVATVFLKDEAAAKAFHTRCVSAGYEGTIRRKPDALYSCNKRSADVEKIKDRMSDEFPVDGIHAGNGNWAGVAKSATLKLPDGRTFGAGIKGDKAFCASLLGEKHNIATVEFEKYSPDGVPLKPVVVMWHGLKRTT